MCSTHDTIILEEKEKKIQNHNDIRNQFEKRMRIIQEGNEFIKVELGKMCYFNETV